MDPLEHKKATKQGCHWPGIVLTAPPAPQGLADTEQGGSQGRRPQHLAPCRRHVKTQWDEMLPFHFHGSYLKSILSTV